MPPAAPLNTSQLDRITRRIEDQARRHALALRRRNAPATDIAAAVAQIVATAGLPELWASAARAEAERTFEWVRDRTLPDAERRLVAGFVARAANQFAMVAAGLQQAVADATTRAIREGLPAAELESLLANKFGKAERHARTIARTALGAFDRADTVRQANLAGVRYMRYVGPPASRDFCQHHLRKTYTVEEIKRLNNGQGLPVLYYGGGWNCRHTWEPVIPKQYLLPELVYANGKHAMRSMSFAKNEADRDDITRQYFNGKVQLVVDDDDGVDEVDEILEMILGRTLSEQEHIRLCGAMDGATVRVHADGDVVRYHVRHPAIRYESVRYLTLAHDRVELHNHVLKLNEDYQGLGLGPRIVATGLIQAELIGVEVVTVTAAGEAGNQDWYGYLQWPKMGFDGPLPKWADRYLPDALRGKVKQFTDFLMYPAGLQWWAKHGTTTELEFDLEGAPLSRVALLEYLQYKGIIL